MWGGCFCFFFWGLWASGLVGVVAHLSYRDDGSLSFIADNALAFQLYVSKKNTMFQEFVLKVVHKSKASLICDDILANVKKNYEKINVNY